MRIAVVASYSHNLLKSILSKLLPMVPCINSCFIFVWIYDNNNNNNNKSIYDGNVSMSYINA